MGIALAALIMSGARAAEDVLMQAVSFAVTGSDAAKVLAIDRQQCVFKVNGNTYYFNNVYADRITIQGKKNGYGSTWTEIALHGKSKLAQIYSAPPEDKGTSVLNAAWQLRG